MTDLATASGTKLQSLQPIGCYYAPPSMLQRILKIMDTDIDSLDLEAEQMVQRPYTLPQQFLTSEGPEKLW